MGAIAYAEIALRLEDDQGEAIGTINDPQAAWVMLEGSYGARQSGIQVMSNSPCSPWQNRMVKLQLPCLMPI